MGHKRHDFSRWRKISDDSGVQIPSDWVLIQVKVNGALLPYPRGKSAMVWYGFGHSCKETVIHALNEIGNAFNSQDLVWRYRPTQNPRDELQVLLDRFNNRFGTPPRMNKRVE